MGNSMSVPKWKFDEEFDSLLNAARFAATKSAAEGFLKQAWSKADGYYNISENLKREYKNRVEILARELGINL